MWPSVSPSVIATSYVLGWATLHLIHVRRVSPLLELPCGDPQGGNRMPEVWDLRGGYVRRTPALTTRGAGAAGVGQVISDRSGHPDRRRNRGLHLPRRHDHDPALRLAAHSEDG